MENRMMVITPEMQDAAGRAGMDPEAWVKRATFRQALQEMNADIARDVIAGLDDVEAGRIASDAQVKDVFERLRGRNG